MADETTTTPGAADVPVPDVIAQEPKLVGDDEIADVVDAGVDVVQETVPAQVTQPRESDPAEVHVHEVTVATDEVITDTSDPRAVQVPDAGRSPLQTSGLPIAQLDNERVEDFFSREASKADKKK
jgi:hypothetical protein